MLVEQVAAVVPEPELVALELERELVARVVAELAVAELAVAVANETGSVIFRGRQLRPGALVAGNG